MHFIDDFDILRLKDDASLAGKVFPTTNIEFAGVNLPWQYYIHENESPDSFRRYWQQRFPQSGNIFDENTFIS